MQSASMRSANIQSSCIQASMKSGKHAEQSTAESVRPRCISPVNAVPSRRVESSRAELQANTWCLGAIKTHICLDKRETVVGFLKNNPTLRQIGTSYAEPARWAIKIGILQSIHFKRPEIELNRN